VRGDQVLRRAGAALATLLGLLASAGLAITAGPPGQWSRYVSTAGAEGAAHPGRYLATALCAAGTLALTGWLLRALVPLAGLILVVGAPLLAASGAVRCTAGCPLPPYAPTTLQDLVHAAASAVAVGCTVLALLQLANSAPPGPLRGIARSAAAVSTPALLATGLGMLFTGQGLLVGVLERTTLAACILGLTAIAATLARSDAGRARRPGVDLPPALRPGASADPSGITAGGDGGG